MPLRIDEQVLAELAPMFEALGEPEPAPIGDIETRRATSRRLFDYVGANREPSPDVEVVRDSMVAGDGTELALGWYRRQGEQPGSAVLYVHGGGMIVGLEQAGAMYDVAVSGYVAASGVPMLVVDYRVAPEYPHPTPVEDCYAALRWLVENAEKLGVDAARVAVMGDSAGGGLAAAVSLLARDRGGPAIAQQLLIYPMLDDRPAKPNPELFPYLTWTYDDNITGWGALLGDDAAGAAVSPYAAPARADDLAGLPDTFIDVGDLDIFRDEDITFAQRLSAAGVPTELHLHPGCPHAFEGLAPNADVSQRAITDRVRRLRTL